MNGGHFVPPHQDGTPCVTRLRVRLHDEPQCRSNHSQPLQYINQHIVPVAHRCNSRARTSSSNSKGHHMPDPCSGSKTDPPMASPEASELKVNAGGCMYLPYKGAERRPAGDPNPPTTNKRQKQHVGVELRTPLDPWGRRCLRVPCVELHAPRANGGRVYRVKPASNKVFSWPHYRTQMQ